MLFYFLEVDKVKMRFRNGEWGEDVMAKYGENGILWKWFLGKYGYY